MLRLFHHITNRGDIHLWKALRSEYPRSLPIYRGLGSRKEQGLEKSGVKVLHREDLNFVEVSEDLADSILALSHCGKAQRAKIGQAATNVSLEAEWKHFIEYYAQAFHLALKKAALRK